MELFKDIVIIISAFLMIGVNGGLPRRWLTPDELENHISPEDLQDFLQMSDITTTTPRSTGNSDTADIEPEQLQKLQVPDLVDCFGLGSVSRSIMKLFNMKPDDSESINTHFYMSSRKNRRRVQVFPGEQFGLDWVDFKPERRTVMIVHGFMSHSNASWVTDMTKAFLEWGDVNVIAVDWSGGGNTWKYWRAVANTRRVGSDIHRFFQQLIRATGAKTKDFHFVGHSLGAHISSFASHLLGGVSRITGLDPAQPCFATASHVEKLDSSDADYVDIIHTNGRLLKKIGFGMPDPMGHADFYPNGGLKQPGCLTNSSSMWSRMISSTNLQQAVCSHGRAYVLFTESLINNNCSFRAHKWDLSYRGVNTSLNGTCEYQHSCAEMGIRAIGQKLSERARGQFILLTTDREPYCVSPKDQQPPVAELLHDLRNMNLQMTTTPRSDQYADPDLVEDRSFETTTAGSWFHKWYWQQHLENGTSLLVLCFEYFLIAIIESIVLFMRVFVWAE